MTKTALIKTELVATGVDADRADRIAAYHTGNKRAFQHQMAYIYLAGAELLAAKEELAHGHFLKWCEQHLAPREISYPTANRYMQVAEALQTKFLAANNSDLPRLALTNGQDIPESHLAAISEAVREVTDGKSLTDLYRELGLVKQPTHQKDRDNSRKQTPAESEAARKEAALAFADLLIGNDLTFCADNESTHQLHADLDAAKIKEVLDAGLTRNRLCKQILKGRARHSVRAASPSNKKKGSRK